MNTNNADKSSSWKNWIIKKLLSNDSTKEDILNFIANDEDNKNIDDLNDNIKSEWFRLYKGELPDSAIMVREHYKNLFELPIFFFLLCIILYLLDRVESIDVILAWIFVFFKILHSFVRLTTNNTRKRAYSFTICYFALLFGWILLVFKLVVY